MSIIVNSGNISFPIFSALIGLDQTHFEPHELYVVEDKTRRKCQNKSVISKKKEKKQKKKKPDFDKIRPECPPNEKKMAEESPLKVWQNSEYIFGTDEKIDSKIRYLIGSELYDCIKPKDDKEDERKFFLQLLLGSLIIDRSYIHKEWNMPIYGDQLKGTLNWLIENLSDDSSKFLVDENSDEFKQLDKLYEIFSHERFYRD